ncbi:hypothetical protein E2C01_013903 [Portunus trituberculatus]|uniref:Uncharacterized protein n=1 Tax=Portunus trituberculatus TaxID=210409 RepID=A0A5B7DIQ7_PORTR|nr:hypothetical protein [Portunus trituberculatus]
MWGSLFSLFCCSPPPPPPPPLSPALHPPEVVLELVHVPHVLLGQLSTPLPVEVLALDGVVAEMDSLVVIVRLSISQPVTASVSQSISLSVNKSLSVHESGSLSANHSASQSVIQSVIIAHLQLVGSGHLDFPVVMHNLVVGCEERHPLVLSQGGRRRHIQVVVAAALDVLLHVAQCLPHSLHGHL